MNVFFKYIRYIYILLAYFICIFYMYKPNTEYLCFILFLILHIFLLLLFLTSRNMGRFNTITLFNAELPIGFFFTIAWILLVVANSMIIQTYRSLHIIFEKVGKPVDLGDLNNVILKDYLKICMIVSTFLLLTLFTFNEINIKLMDTLSNNTMNKILIGVSSGALLYSCLSVYIANLIGVITNTITTPN